MSEQCVYLCTTNDRMGNPRRAWVFTETGGQGQYRHVYFEGYGGMFGVADELTDERKRLASGAMKINVGAREWKRLTYRV
jgi:hypothetical protein